MVDAAKDVNKKEVSDPSHYLTNLLGYRAVMALEWIDTAETGKIDVEEIGKTRFPDMAYKYPDTPLKVFYPMVIEGVLLHDTLRRIVVDAYMEFEAILAKLEARARDPDFWKATV